MIFLAVTLGFFAENVREHFDEEKTTKQYLEDFRQELLQNKDLYQRYDNYWIDDLIIIFAGDHTICVKRSNERGQALNNFNHKK